MPQSKILNKIRIFLIINKVDEMAKEHLKFLKTQKLDAQYRHFEKAYKELCEQHQIKLETQADYKPTELFAELDRLLKSTEKEDKEG
ncbi:MAG: hypothetical protein ACYCQI_13590, partial [Gammaproteobacteria bacterium]